MSAWKPNHFVATNKSENFRIDYYDQEGGSRKGSINCCGYKAESCDEGILTCLISFIMITDRLNFLCFSLIYIISDELSPHGIKVVPSSESRRTFFLKFETPEDRDEWLEILNNACAKAEPAKDEDELIRKAFSYAYHDIRVHYGM